MSDKADFPVEHKIWSYCGRRLETVKKKTKLYCTFLNHEGREVIYDMAKGDLIIGGIYKVYHVPGNPSSVYFKKGHPYEPQFIELEEDAELRSRWVAADIAAVQRDSEIKSAGKEYDAELVAAINTISTALKDMHWRERRSFFAYLMERLVY